MFAMMWHEPVGMVVIPWLEVVLWQWEYMELLEE